MKLLALTTLIAFCAASPAPAAAAAAETAAAKPQRQCFFTRNVSNFSAVDDQTVNVRVGVKDVYRLDMLGHCPDIDWTQQIALISRGGSSICTGMDATIVVKSPIGPQRCAVKTIRKLTPEEVAALPRKAKP